jgi:hypothetical protein
MNRTNNSSTREESRPIGRQIGLLSIVGFVGLVGTANAQTLSTLTAGPAFDGTYQATSAAKVNQMYIAQKGNMGVCPDRMPGPLTIVQGEAQYTDASGDQVDGTVGPQGELAMRAAAPGGARAMELAVSGNIAANGTVRARQEGNSCSYDFVWQRTGPQTTSTAGRSLSIVSSPASGRAG